MCDKQVDLFVYLALNDEPAVASCSLERSATQLGPAGVASNRKSRCRSEARARVCFMVFVSVCVCVCVCVLEAANRRRSMSDGGHAATTATVGRARWRWCRRWCRCWSPVCAESCAVGRVVVGVWRSRRAGLPAGTCPKSCVGSSCCVTRLMV